MLKVDEFCGLIYSILPHFTGGCSGETRQGFPYCTAPIHKLIFKTSKGLFIYANQTQGVNIYIELLNTFVAIFDYFFES